MRFCSEEGKDRHTRGARAGVGEAIAMAAVRMSMNWTLSNKFGEEGFVFGGGGRGKKVALVFGIVL
jgi:hypothetical protein